MAKNKQMDSEQEQVVEQPFDMDAEIDKITPKRGKSEASFGSKVNVRITKFGHGHVSTGEHIPEHGDKLAPAGSKLEVDKSVADALEAKGYAEIVE